MRAKKIKPQRLASRGDAAGLLVDSRQSADCFQNLCEMPTMFYGWTALVVASGTATPGLAAASWVYTALRAAQAGVHCSYNRVMHRFSLYFTSSTLLFGMWAVWGARL